MHGDLLGTSGLVFLADTKHTELAQHGLRSPPAAAGQDMDPELLQRPGKQGRAGGGGPLPQAAAWQSVKTSSLRGLLLVA